MLCFSLLPVASCALLLVGPPLFANTDAPWSSVLGILIVSVEAAVLCLCKRIGTHRLLPRCLIPLRHRYDSHGPPATIAEDSECSICKLPMIDPGAASPDELWTTPCHHHFHMECLRTWMYHRMECPLCRQQLPEP